MPWTSRILGHAEIPVSNRRAECGLFVGVSPYFKYLDLSRQFEHDEVKEDWCLCASRQTNIRMGTTQGPFPKDQRSKFGEKTIDQGYILVARLRLRSRHIALGDKLDLDNLPQ